MVTSAPTSTQTLFSTSNGGQLNVFVLFFYCFFSSLSVLLGQFSVIHSVSSFQFGFLFLLRYLIFNAGKLNILWFCLFCFNWVIGSNSSFFQFNFPFLFTMFNFYWWGSFNILGFFDVFSRLF